MIGITTPDGESRAVYTYDPFGKPLTATGTMAAINPLRYRGYYYDKESGLYYLKSRYFDPGICRFINADSFASTGQGFVGYNMFAYCNDNPVNLYDKNGNDPASAVAKWTACAWWLSFVDGPIPICDIVYWGGIGILALYAVIVMSDESDNSVSNSLSSGQYTDYPELSEDIYSAGNRFNLPPSRKVKINMDHILSGHSAGGNRGPNKDRFPKWVTPSLIEKAIRQAYEHAHKAGPMRFSFDHGVEVTKQFFRGEWVGGIIEFWYNYTTKTIETAWPK